MNYKIVFLIMSLFLSLTACSQVAKSGQKSDELTQVVINSDKGQTVYWLNQMQKVQKCEITDLSGEKTQRIYSYDTAGNLQHISKTSTSGDRAEIYISQECSRSDKKITRKVIEETNSRNKSISFECEYKYGSDGELENIVQTDNNGNIKKKSLNKDCDVIGGYTNGL
jgi:hypothetical protein